MEATRKQCGIQRIPMGEDRKEILFALLQKAFWWVLTGWTKAKGSFSRTSRNSIWQQQHLPKETMNPGRVSSRMDNTPQDTWRKQCTAGEERWQTRQEHRLLPKASTSSDGYPWCEHSVFLSHVSQPQQQRSCFQYVQVLRQGQKIWRQHCCCRAGGQLEGLSVPSQHAGQRF